MYGWLSRAGEEATHVVTASRRLARVLSNEYNVLRAYYGESSPTGAQTAQALKAVIRVLREQAKDDD